MAWTVAGLPISNRHCTSYTGRRTYHKRCSGVQRGMPDMYAGPCTHSMRSVRGGGESACAWRVAGLPISNRHCTSYTGRRTYHKRCSGVQRGMPDMYAGPCTHSTHSVRVGGESAWPGRWLACPSVIGTVPPTPVGVHITNAAQGSKEACRICTPGPARTACAA